MRLLDVNVLMYATFDAFPQHVAAKRWLDEKLSSPREQVAIPWETISGFVRLASNPKVLTPALPVVQAWKIVESWLSAPAAWVPVCTERHRQFLEPFLGLPDMNHKLVADAHLAALAMEYGLVLVSADTDFRKFPGLRFECPF